MKKLIIYFASLAITVFCFTFEASGQNSGKVYWNGMVDNKVQLVVKGLSFEERTIAGQAAPAGAFSFTAPLPTADATVRAIKLEGRGTKVSVVQQPNSANDFTAIIEISDERGGAGEYLIEIAW
jgi:hypothetical protein